MKVQRHCGVIRNTGSRVFVVWRELPEEPEFALVVYRDSIPDAYASSVLELVMGKGQNSINLYDVMDKIGVLEGKNMLNALHRMGYLKKVPVAAIDVHIGGTQKISLDDLNKSLNDIEHNKSDKVKDYNPLTDNNNENQEETGAVIGSLLSQAKEYDQKAKELYARAKNLNPELVIPGDSKISEGEKTIDGKVLFYIDPQSSQAAEIARLKLIHAEAKKQVYK